MDTPLDLSLYGLGVATQRSDSVVQTPPSDDRANDTRMSIGSTPPEAVYEAQSLFDRGPRPARPGIPGFTVHSPSPTRFFPEQSEGAPGPKGKGRVPPPPPQHGAEVESTPKVNYDSEYCTPSSVICAGNNMFPNLVISCALIRITTSSPPEPIMQTDIRIPQGSITYHHVLGNTISTGLFVQTLRDEPTVAFRHALSRPGLLATSRHYYYGDDYQAMMHGYCVLGQLSVFLTTPTPPSQVRSLSKDFDDHAPFLSLYGDLDINKFFILFVDTRGSSQSSTPAGSPLLSIDPLRLSPTSLPLTLKRPSPDAEEGAPTDTRRRRVSSPGLEQHSQTPSLSHLTPLESITLSLGHQLVDRARFTPPV